MDSAGHFEEPWMKARKLLRANGPKEDFSYEKIVARLPHVFAFLSSGLRVGRYPDR